MFVLLELVEDKNYFVLTANVDQQFQLAGFDLALPHRHREYKCLPP